MLKYVGTVFVLASILLVGLTQATPVSSQTAGSGDLTVEMAAAADGSSVSGVVEIYSDPDGDGVFDTFVLTVAAPETVSLPYDRYRVVPVSAEPNRPITAGQAPVVVSVDRPVIAAPVQFLADAPAPTATTTAAPTTVVPTTVVPTTVVPTTVVPTTAAQPSSTQTAPAPTTSTSVPVASGNEVGATNTPEQPETLAFTGVNDWFARIGLIMAIVGVLLVFFEYRALARMALVLFAIGMFATVSGGTGSGRAEAQTADTHDMGPPIRTAMQKASRLWYVGFTNYKGTWANAAHLTTTAHGNTPGQGDVLVISTGRSLDYEATDPNLVASTVGTGRVSDDGLDSALARFSIEPAERNGARPNCVSVAFRILTDEPASHAALGYGDTVRMSMARNGTSFTLDTAIGELVTTNSSIINAEPNGPFRRSSDYAVVLMPLSDDTQQSVFEIEVIDGKDNLYDTAVLLDTMRWVYGRDSCNGEMFDYTDNDGDGLPNAWEIDGADLDFDGDIDIDLPAIHANPNRVDLYVESDWWDRTDVNPGDTRGGFDAYRAEMARLPNVNPDGSTGMDVHIDSGPDSIITAGRPETWGAMSRGNAINLDSEPTKLNSNGVLVSPGWLDRTRPIHQEVARRSVFRWYVITGPPFQYGSGVATVPGTWVSMADGYSGGPEIFMHEGGHTMGLGHGGAYADGHKNIVDGTGNKPNYLSMMNYRYGFGFPLDGVQVDRFNETPMATLDENNLDERVGVQPIEQSNRTNIIWTCPDKSTRNTNGVGAPIDWDCDGVIEESVKANINGDSAVDEDTGDRYEVFGLLRSETDIDKFTHIYGGIGSNRYVD